MSWYQTEITISGKSRGFNLITDEILNNIAEAYIGIGWCNLYIVPA